MNMDLLGIRKTGIQEKSIPTFVPSRFIKTKKARRKASP
jgi:hypothetical protein